MSSQATSKAATEETRDRAERGSAVRGSDRATVVAEEDGRRRPARCSKNNRAPRSLKLPTLESLDGLIQRRSLIPVLCSSEKILVRLDRQINGLVVVLGASKARGVVGEIGLGQVVSREPFRHLLPTGYALSRIGFGQRPQMPGGAVVGVGRNRPRREIAYDFGTRTDQPVVVGKRNERFRIVRTLGHRPLERGQWINRFFTYLRCVRFSHACQIVVQSRSRIRLEKPPAMAARLISSLLQFCKSKGKRKVLNPSHYGGLSPYRGVPFNLLLDNSSGR